MKFRSAPKSELVLTMLQNRDGDVKGYLGSARGEVNSRFLASLGMTKPRSRFLASLGMTRFSLRSETENIF
jgi:hypothetical protein